MLDAPILNLMCLFDKEVKYGSTEIESLNILYICYYCRCAHASYGYSNQCAFV